MEEPVKLTDFSTLTFDCYGTLIDWESGMVSALEPLTSRLQQALPRNEILSTHARYESFQQSHAPTMPYPEILATVYKRMAEQWGLSTSWAECLRYGQSVKAWLPFVDSADALAYLKQHYRLVVLSNVDNDSFAASNERLGVTFDAVYTAQDIGSYKPHDRNFAYMIESLARLGVEQGEILHTAESLYHDHRPANEYGLKSCWINRRRDQEGTGATMPLEISPQYDFRFSSMAEMADAHRKHFA